MYRYHLPAFMYLRGWQHPVPDAIQRFQSMEVIAMRYYCSFTWFPHVSRDMVAKRLVEQHDAGENNPDNIIGWYNLAGGGAGFLIVDYDDPRGVTRFLSPYMDLMSFDVRAVYELDYDERIEELRAITSDD
ncbi:MAG: DUF3303 family protein [Thermomicrobiales bacterium]